MSIYSTSPRVSIVIPTFNTSKQLISTVESVLAQTFRDWELILFDDGSGDDTNEIARSLAARDSRIRLGGGVNRGPAVARNEGFRLTTPQSEFVIFLDHDDTWEPEALSLLVDALDSHPQCVAAHGLVRGTDMDGRQFDGDDLEDSLRRRFEPRGDQQVELSVSSPTTFAAMLLRNWVVTQGAALIRRTALDVIGGFEPSTTPSDDWDLNVRLARQGDFSYVDRVILNWHRDPKALSYVSKRWKQSYMIVRRRTIECASNTPSQRESAVNMLQSDCRSGRSRFFHSMARGRLRSALGGLLESLLAYRCYYGLKFRPTTPK